MIATVVHISVKPEYIDEFIAISKYNHENARLEEGNIRFDFLRDNSDPNKFILYEVYTDADAVAAHKETEHYKKWRDIVAPMMAEPRRGIPTTPLAFD